MTIADPLALFYASNPEGPTQVTTISVHHPAWGDLYFTNYGRSWRGKIEGDVEVDFFPLAFTLVEPGQKQGTEQTLQAAVDGYEGRLYKQLRELTVAQRLIPITLVYRVFLDNDPNSLLNAPPPVFEVRQINAETGKLTISAVARNLANRPAGQVYTVERFPTLSRR